MYTGSDFENKLALDFWLKIVFILIYSFIIKIYFKVLIPSIKIRLHPGM